MGCYATGSLAAGGTGGDGQSGNATTDPASRTTVHLWPTGQPELWEAIPSELGGLGTLGVTFDAGGQPVEAASTGDLFVPFACTITQWTLLADQAGSIVIDIRKTAYSSAPPSAAHSIVGTATPSLSSAVKNQSSTLTGWTTAVTANEVLRFVVTSADTLFRAVLELTVRKG